MTTQNETNATIDTFKTALKQKETNFINAVAAKSILAGLLAAVIGYFKPEIESIFPHFTFLLMAIPFVMMNYVLKNKITWEKPHIYIATLMLSYVFVSSTLNVPAVAIFVITVSVIFGSLSTFEKLRLLAMDEYIKFNDVDDEEKIKIIENQFMADHKAVGEQHAKPWAFSIGGTIAFMVYSSAPFFI